MKIFDRMKRIAMMSAVILAAVACQRGELAPQVEYLEVNYNNVSGSWALDSYDGKKLTEGVYQYINFERSSKDSSQPLPPFQEYTNINSQYAVGKIGRYQLSETEDGRARIRGTYTMELEREWNHAYIIRELTADRMVWVAEDDLTIINVYVRTAIPADLLGEPEE